MALSKRSALIGAGVGLVVTLALLMVIMKKDDKRPKNTKMLLDALLAIAVIVTVGMGAVGFGWIKTSDAAGDSASLTSPDNM